MCDKSFDKLLFTKDDYTEMAFFMAPSGSVRQEVKELIQKHGGRLYGNYPMDVRDHMIKLVTPDLNILKGDDYFLYTYIENCVQEKRLLENLIEYRQNKNSKYKEYNPLDILLGHRSWQDIELKDEGKRTEFDDDFEEKAETFRRNNKYRHAREGFRRMPYTEKEDLDIINHIIQQRSYQLVDGNTLWKRMAEKGICNNSRTWSSMKERFRKLILPRIHTYDIAPNHVICFKTKSDEEKRNLVSADLSDSDCSIDGNVTPTKSIRKEAGEQVLSPNKDDNRDDQQSESSTVPNHKQPQLSKQIEPFRSIDIQPQLPSTSSADQILNQDISTGKKPVHDRSGDAYESGEDEIIEQLRDAVHPDMSFNNSQILNVTPGRTLSTDSDRYTKKKRKLYCPEKSTLDEFAKEPLIRTRQKYIPSPVVSSSMMQETLNRNEEEIDIVSSQEFNAGLRSAGSQDETSGGGITSTQNIEGSSPVLDTTCTVPPVLGQVFQVNDGTNEQELNLHISQSQTSVRDSPNINNEPEQNSPNLLNESTAKSDTSKDSSSTIENLASSVSKRYPTRTKEKASEFVFFSNMQTKTLDPALGKNGERLLVPETPHEDMQSNNNDLCKDFTKRRTSSPLMINLADNNEDNENVNTGGVVELEAGPSRSVLQETPRECNSQNSSKQTENIENKIDLNDSNADKNKNDNIDQDDQITNDADCDRIETDRLAIDATDAANEKVDANEDDIDDDKETGVLEDDINEVHSGDENDLPGILSNQDNELDVNINDVDDEILGESDQENDKGTERYLEKQRRIRNPTKFRKHIKTRGNVANVRSQHIKTKSKAIMINLPSDIGSSDIEVVTRHKKGIRRKEDFTDESVKRPAFPQPRTSKRLPSTSESSDDNAAPPKGKRPKKRTGRILSSGSESSVSKDPNTSTPFRSRAVSGEAESLAEMIARSPPSACCKNINSTSGMPMRRRSSSASAAGMESSVPSIGQHDSQVVEEPEQVDKGEKSKKLMVLVQSNSNTTSCKFREPYTLDEEKLLLQYFMKKGGYSKWKGTLVWKKLETANYLPGRSWQSMKQRFKIMLLNNRLDKHGVTEAMLSEADKRIYHRDEEVDSEGEEESNDTTNKKKTKPYTVEEDKKILKYIIDNNRYNDTGGRALWEIMEERQICGTRTYQSMKERFRKRILKNIKNYNLTDEQVKHFKNQLPADKNEKQRRHRK